MEEKKQIDEMKDLMLAIAGNILSLLEWGASLKYKNFILRKNDKYYCIYKESEHTPGKETFCTKFTSFTNSLIYLNYGNK